MKISLAKGSFFCPGYLDDVDWVKCEKEIALDRVNFVAWKN